jgi:hypothetical protein
MKKRYYTLLLAALASFVGGVASAQEEVPAQFKLYGFIRNYMAFDTHEVNAGTQDLYFYMPKDRRLAEDGRDLAEVPTFRMLALTTRLGLNVSGYRIGETKVSGAVEGDFYCMNGSVATFRLRQAYIGMLWDNLELGDLLVNVGQTWHPMAADMPHMTNLETGAPFNPFNRSPQIMAHWTVGKFTWTGGILYPMQYLPTGPNGKSADYNKYGLIPEVYLGVALKSGGFLGKVGVDFFSIKPRWNAPVITQASVDGDERILKYDVENTKQLQTRLYAISPFVYLQLTKGKFQLKAKSILAQAGEHMNLLSGYGATFDWNRLQLTYTPMQDLVSFVSFQYGRKWQIMCMAGYMQRLGTTKALFAYDNADVASLWLNTSADPSIQQAFRATPTLAYNLGKLTFSLEYNCTGAFFGEGPYNRGGLYGSGHWVLNHRIEQMVKFNF